MQALKSIVRIYSLISVNGYKEQFPAVEFLLEMSAMPSITPHIGILRCPFLQ
jgi:hypothetical protein